MKKNDGATQYSFRLPDELRKTLEETAKDQERTLSQEIIYRLRKSLQDGSSEVQK